MIEVFFVILFILPILNLYVLIRLVNLEKKHENLKDFIGCNCSLFNDITSEEWEEM